MSTSLFAIIIGAIFVNNYILVRFLGLCPFFGVSKKTKSAIGMSLSVIFVVALASMATWLSYYYILVPLHVEYLQIIVFILVIATLVQFVELFLKRYNPFLYKSLGIYLPLITTNCIVLGVALLNIKENYSFIEATVFGIAAPIGFALALMLMSGIRERLELSKVPKAFQGLPIAFIVAALMSMAFLAFSGMI